MPQRPHVLHGHPDIRNFFADRCTHLAAMVAYYALLSLLPLLAIALALIGVFGRADEVGSAIFDNLTTGVDGCREFWTRRPARPTR